MGSTNKLISNLFFDESSDLFFKDMREEFIEQVIQQYGYYITVSVELTQTESLYREAKKKIFNRPVKIYGILVNDDPEPNGNVNGMSDVKYTFKFYIAPELLIQQGIIPKDGDFIWIDKVFYKLQSHYYSRNYPAYVLNCVEAKQQEIDIKITEDEIDF